MFTLKQRFMLMALLFITALTNAQNINVTGRILDSEQNPLPGAGVVVSGTNSGTTADIDGKFSVNVPADATLEVSYLGYETQMVKVNSRAVIDVVLEEESNFLNETVVVGYGTQKKVNLTGSVSTTDYAEIAKSRPITSTAAALSGMSAGVMVRQTSSNPGSEGIDIRIRGVGTLNSSAPLVIEDGYCFDVIGVYIAD